MEKCLLLVYGLFKNLKNLTFVMVRCHKTLNGAIYIYMAQFNTRQHLRLEMGQNLNFKVLAILILMAPATSHSFSELNRLLGNWG